MYMVVRHLVFASGTDKMAPPKAGTQGFWRGLERIISSARNDSALQKSIELQFSDTSPHCKGSKPMTKSPWCVFWIDKTVH